MTNTQMLFMLSIGCFVASVLSEPHHLILWMMGAALMLSAAIGDMVRIRVRRADPDEEQNG